MRKLLCATVLTTALVSCSSDGETPSNTAAATAPPTTLPGLAGWKAEYGDDAVEVSADIIGQLVALAGRSLSSGDEAKAVGDCEALRSTIETFLESAEATDPRAPDGYVAALTQLGDGASKCVNGDFESALADFEDGADGLTEVADEVAAAE